MTGTAARRWLGAAAAGIIAFAVPLALTAAPAHAETGAWKAIASGSGHTCAIADDSHVYCWGDNTLGQIGAPSTIPVAPAPTEGSTAKPAPAPAPAPIPTPTPVEGAVAGQTFIAIAAGDNHTCALSSDHKVLCWGASGNGQLGNGVQPTEGGPTFSATAVDIVGNLAGLTVNSLAAGGNTSCAITSDGVTYCWGDNSAGQLGIGAAGPPRATPTGVSTRGVLRDRTVTQVAVGTDHACAVDSTGIGYCWGNNKYGQIGSGVPHRGGEGGQYLLPTKLDPLFTAANKVSHISAGSSFSCATATPSGSSIAIAYCWGELIKGRLGDGYSGTNQDASVFSPTAVPTKQAADPTKDAVLAGRDLRAVSSAGATTCVLDRVGSAVCWGDSETGQVGNGEAGSPKPLPPTAVVTARPYAGVGLAGISVGTNHVCGVNAAKAGGAASCWGSNGTGQLGLGVLNTTVTGTPRAVISATASPSPAPTSSGGPTDPATPDTPTASSGGGSWVTTLLAFLAGVVVASLGAVLISRRRAPTA
ncbi:MAG: hypothetical protein NTZ03_12350 [Actinobacteria bacterium]|nr:hypothetical protein [Actinomycetota bacterium]